MEFAKASAPTAGHQHTGTEQTGPSDHQPLSVQMTRLLTGFEISQAVYAVAKLDIATTLLDGPLPVEKLATRTGTHTDSLRRLFRMLTSVGVTTQPSEDVFAVTPLGATLARGTADSVRDLAIMLMETHYAPFGCFVETVRTGMPAATLHYGMPFIDWVTADPERSDLFSAAMASMTGSLQGDVFADYHLPAGETIVDLGGADGSVLQRLLRDAPARRGVVFDLPHVVPAARTRMSEGGLVDRVDVVAGDFFERVPIGDIYVLSTVLHDWDDHAAQAILRRVASTAAPGARLVLVEMIMPIGDEPHFSKSAEFDTLLAGAGFHLDRVVEPRGAGPYSILEATLPRP